MNQKTGSPPRGASANNDRQTTLDPTGMFRNRGRHVVSKNTVPQDRRPRGGSDQSSAASGFNAEQLRDVVSKEESSSNSPERSLTNPGESDTSNIHRETLVSAQSSGAPSGEEASCNNMETYIAQVSSIEADCEPTAAAESTYQSNRGLSRFNSKNLGLTVQNKELEEADETDSSVSIMGSIINDDLDGDGGLKKMDVFRWKSAMKTYRSDGKSEVQDVQEDRGSDADNQAENTDAISHDVDISVNSEPELAVNAELQQLLLNDTVNSEGENDALNTSMECHVDTSRLLDESIMSQHERMDNIPANAVVQVANFTDINNSDGLLLSDVISANKNHIINQGKNTIQGNDKSPVHQPTRGILGQESPLRAAFRRTENNIRRITSPRLPPSTSVRVSNNSALPLPLQLATKCFSFDDTTIDEDATVPYQPQLDMFRQNSPKKRLPRQQKQYQQSRNPEYYGLSGVASFPYKEESSLKKTIPLNRTPKSFSGAFCSSNYSRDRQKSSDVTSDEGSSFQVIRQSKTWGGIGNHEITALPSSNRTTIIFNSDTESDQIHLPYYSDGTQYKLEKARMLLSQMVNQVTSFNNAYISHFKAAICTECTAKTDNSSFRCERCHDQLKLVVNSIKEANSLHSNLNADVKTEESHEMRSDVIDALFECYNLTRDLNKSAIAAHDWLVSERDRFASYQSTKSQSVDTKDEEIRRLNAEILSCREEIGKLRNTSQPSVVRSMLSNSSEDSIDACLRPENSLVLCSPHPVVKLSESHEESFARFERRMDAELKVESLKEIIKLRAALEEANRKIATLERYDKSQLPADPPFLSDVDPIEPATSSDDGEIFMKIADDIENSTNEPMLSDEFKACDNAGSLDKIRLDDPCLEKELNEYRAAIIESVTAHGVTDVAQDISKSCESEATEQKMISVRMLDAENFITEWDAVSPLPPPPDHGLHSPIVDTILSRWTDNQQTQGSLITWVESILEGSSPHDVPPLKIGGLDHQLKEGFIMHIFPLLLRRKDIHLQVTSRATRTTSYDIAVSITSSLDGFHQTTRCESDRSIGEPRFMQPPLRDNKHHLMAFRATCNGSTKESDNSQLSDGPQQHGFPDILRSGSNAGSCFTAVTTPISNRTPTKYANSSHAKKLMSEFVNPAEPQLPIMAGASPSLVDDLSVGSSFDDEEINQVQEHHNGIIQSIGGAFGLLSRKKMHVPSNRPRHHKSILDGVTESPHRTVLTPQRHAANSIDYDHPYHRLVSAPPGKIGLTFIEHRGHCMVSNVSGSSPLAGYVHPSDILIAIDDAPVSGLRTREIVSILTAKKERRRDLRMISSHDMNELIRPGTV